MKYNSQAYESFNSSLLLNNDQLTLIKGGAAETSFWEDVAFLAGRTLRCFYEFTTGAVKYQHSLPANLKK